jgi:YebC/PmpR family DNA-binding regulatory protein
MEEIFMSGHSKWSTIKHKKGVADIKKGKVFSQLAKQIRIAVKEGKSGDPKFNPTLRLALEKARAANMPNANIQRAIDRGLGKGKGGAIQEVVYEGFGPHGVGFIVVAMTDNLQRTSGEVRAAFSKAGGSLGGPGTAMYLFQRQGDEYHVTIPMEITDPEIQETTQDLMDTFRENEDVEDVYCAGVWEGKE